MEALKYHQMKEAQRLSGWTPEYTREIRIKNHIEAGYSYKIGRTFFIPQPPKSEWQKVQKKYFPQLSLLSPQKLLEWRTQAWKNHRIARGKASKYLQANQNTIEEIFEKNGHPVTLTLEEDWYNKEIS